MQTFRDYMEAALYDPERGFYSNRTPTQDFYTAPELHPAFAGVLAREIARRFEVLEGAGVSGPYTLFEMGCGSGRLSADIIRVLKEDFPKWGDSINVVLIERSLGALDEARIRLSCCPVTAVESLRNAPAAAGVFLSNELVDAFPVHLLEKRNGEMLEVFVEPSGATRLGGFSTGDLKPYAAAVIDTLEEGQRHAVNLEARRWLRAAAEKLTAGFIVTIDYGHRMGAAPNPPRTFFRHTTDFRLTEGKGFKDITASVDFDQLIDQGERLGLAIDAYEPLGRFLLEGGITDFLPPLRGGTVLDNGMVPQGDDVAAIRSRGQVKTLLHPDGMGETFKVLIQKRIP